MSGTDQINVIYILSNGRSGSTLLDLLLGAHPRIWTLGEAHMLPWEVRWKGPCGCGKPHEECGFWEPLLPQLPLEDQEVPVELFRADTPNGGGKVLRWSHLPSMARGRASGRWAEPARRYGLANRRYFETVLDAARRHKGEQVAWLVDASKCPYRLLWLESSGLFNIRVVHLYKDPRAFVFSMTKPMLPRATRKVIRFTGRWLFENSLFTLLGERAFMDRMVHLPYERLASDPEGSLAELGRFVGLDMPAGLSESFRTAETHGVSGNPMRWESTTVKLDQKWKTKLPAHYIGAVAAAAWPLRRVLDKMSRTPGQEST